MLKCDFIVRINRTLMIKKKKRNGMFFHLDNKDIQMESKINNSLTPLILSSRWNKIILSDSAIES